MPKPLAAALSVEGNSIVIEGRPIGPGEARPAPASLIPVE